MKSGLSLGFEASSTQVTLLPRIHISLWAEAYGLSPPPQQTVCSAQKLCNGHFSYLSF